MKFSEPVIRTSMARIATTNDREARNTSVLPVSIKRFTEMRGRRRANQRGDRQRKGIAWTGWRRFSCVTSPRAHSYHPEETVPCHE